MQNKRKLESSDEDDFVDNNKREKQPLEKVPASSSSFHSSFPPVKRKSQDWGDHASNFASVASTSKAKTSFVPPLHSAASNLNLQSTASENESELDDWQLANSANEEEQVAKDSKEEQLANEAKEENESPRNKRVQLCRKSRQFIEGQKVLREAAKGVASFGDLANLLMNHIDLHFEENSRSLQKLYVQGHEGMENMQAIVDNEEKQTTILTHFDSAALTKSEEKDIRGNLKIPFKTYNDLCKAVLIDGDTLRSYIIGQYPYSLKKEWVNTFMKGIFNETFAKRLLYSAPKKTANREPIRQIRMGKTCLKLPGAISYFFWQLIEENPLIAIDRKKEHRKHRNFFDRGNRNLREEEIARLIQLAIKEDPSKGSQIATLLICDDLLQFALGINEARPDMECEEACTNWLARNGEAAWRNLQQHKKMKNITLDELTYRQIIKKCMNERQTIALFICNAEKLKNSRKLENMELMGEIV